MHVRWMAVALLCSCLWPGLARAQASRVQSDQDILIELEHNWDAAFRRHEIGRAHV